MDIANTCPEVQELTALAQELRAAYEEVAARLERAVMDDGYVCPMLAEEARSAFIEWREADEEARDAARWVREYEDRAYSEG